MRSLISFFIGLVIGAAGGAYVAKSFSDKKAEDRIEKATVEARDYYKEKFEKKEEPKPDVVMPNEMFRVYGKAYDIYTEPPAPEPGAETYAYEIPQEEFGEDAEYSTYSLDYYSDGNLVDETGNIVDDPIHLVGGDILDELSVTNPTAYVRNDITKTDYEISFVDDEYSQFGGEKD